MDRRFLITLATASLLGGAGLLYADAGFWGRGWDESDYPLSVLIGTPFGDGSFWHAVNRMPGGYCLMIIGILLLVWCVIVARRGPPPPEAIDRLGTAEHHGIRRRR